VPFEMPSTNVLLAMVGLPIFAMVVARSYSLLVNYLQARKLGVPIIVIPFSWQDALWVLLLPLLRRFRNVYGLRNMLQFSHHTWPQDQRYGPHKRLGNVFAVVSPGRWDIHINDPAATVEVLSQWRTWLKPDDVYDIFDTFGPNVLSSNGEDWQRHRRIANPAFREQNNKLVWEESLRQAKQMSQILGDPKRGGQRTMGAVRDDCVLIAMHVLSAAGFGHMHDFDSGFREIPEGHTTSLAEALKYLLEHILFNVIFVYVPPLGWVMPGIRKRLAAMDKEFRQYMKELIAYNRAVSQGGGNSTADIISALVEADEAAKKDHKSEADSLQAKPMHLTDAELLGDLYIFNLAGFETTANALTYTLPFLAVNPDIQSWLAEEVDTVLAGRDVEKLPYNESFPSLVRCLAVMYETLRLWGPIPSTKRWCVGEPAKLRVGDREFVIPPNVYVSLNMYGIMNDPVWWGEDSMEWKPKRWITIDPKTGKETLASPPPGATFVPWSAGPRCVSRASELFARPMLTRTTESARGRSSAKSSLSPSLPPCSRSIASSRCWWATRRRRKRPGAC
jgi:cytochrome P450